MNATLVQPESSDYPAGLEQAFGDRTLPALSAIGDRALLRCRSLALFCSIQCPGEVILRTFDLIRALRDAGIPMIGGFHSPMEKECLTLLLRGTRPVTICPARSIEGMRIPGPWREPLAEGRLLVLSPFDQKDRRVTAGTSQTRNLFVAALAGPILVAHAGAGSRTEVLVRKVLSLGKPILTVACTENHNWVASGARRIGPDDAWKLANHSGQHIS